MSSRTTWLVIPCFNEVARLARQEIAELVASDDVGVVLVDDGSDDGTRELMVSIQSAGPGVDVQSTKTRGLAPQPRVEQDRLVNEDGPRTGLSTGK